MQKHLLWQLGILVAGLIALTSACTSSHSTHDKAEADTLDSISIAYARNFQVETLTDNVRLLTITNPESRHGSASRFALVYNGAEPDSLPGDCQVVRVPVERFICMTSLQLSNFIALGETSRVKGITSTRHLFNDRMNSQLADGTTVQIGIEGNFDNEMIIATDPQLILISPSKRGGYDVLKESGLPLMPHLGYQEPHPLGQAEWLKVIGMLTGREREATELFDSIASRYNNLRQLAQKAATRPTIMSGDMKGGNWYATGGRSFLAKILDDAGSDYFMKDDESTGGVNLDFETVYAQGADAEYWRVSNSYEGDFTYEELAKQDSRFRDFRALKERKVIYCNMNQVPFYEAMPVHPDDVLADFIHVFHPELLPEHTPVFYHLMK